MKKSGIHPGQKFELLIDGVGSRGEGIGKVNGRAVFVPRSLPGERVLVRVVHVGSRKVSAEPCEVVDPSPDRVRSPCSAFGRCGGCQLMHVAYPAQLKLKQIILADALRSVAGLDGGKTICIHPAPAPLGYRNRGQYPVARHGQRVVTGFFAPRTHQVVSVDTCLIHDHRIDRAVSCVRAWANQKRIAVYDEERHRGFLRHVVVRTSGRGQVTHCQKQRDLDGGDLLVTLVATSEMGKGIGALVRRLRKQIPDVSGLMLNINPLRTNVILGERSHLLWGRPWVEEKIEGIRFKLSQGSFFQVNTSQAGVLFERVVDFIKPAQGAVVDAYCGVGVLGLLLAGQGHRVTGIEVVRKAVEDAREAALENRLTRCSFQHGKVERVLPRLVREGLRPSAVVLDPPRKGCAKEVLQAIAASSALRVAYLSCHPGTLARDLAMLLEFGFRLERLEAVDMFPQTAHVEVFAGLVRIEG